jgi:hypothetical protein
MAVLATAAEQPYGKGMTEANIERLVLCDMADVSAWHNESPAETKLSSSDAHVRQGKFALKFANVVDHTTGEKNYPIGWPRTTLDLAKAKLTDWSEYDFFECWIYVETSRAALPRSPLSLGLTHPGHKASTGRDLREVCKDQWTKIVIPMTEVKDPKNVLRVRFNISESNYQHGDRVDFYICDMVLGRYATPAIAELTLEQNLLYTDARSVAAQFRLVGRQGMDKTTAELEVGCGDASPVAKASCPATREGEIAVPLPARLSPGQSWARLNLRDSQGRLIDRKSVEFRVIAGPF